MKRIGRQIKYYRFLSQMSQRQLAQAVGVLQGTVSQWEAEDCNPTIDKLPLIAKALGVTEMQLVDDSAPWRPKEIPA